MSKAYTEDDLAFQTDADLTWRIRELSELKAATTTSGPVGRTVLLRALVAILYAHWEGHAKYCATKYFEFLTLRRLKYSELERQLYLNSFLKRLDALFGARTSVSQRCELAVEILGSEVKRFAWVDPSLIDTKSNLNSSVLRDLCVVCGLDYALFEPSETYIDVLLLKRRNSIAHGEDEQIHVDEMDGLVDQGIALMRLFKNSLQNKVFTKTYLRPSPAAA